MLHVTIVDFVMNKLISFICYQYLYFFHHLQLKFKRFDFKKKSKNNYVF
jgi:hypothetical protein